MSKVDTVIDTGWDAIITADLKQKAPYYAKVIEDLKQKAPYYAKAIEEIDNGKGYWQYIRVGVFDRQDKQLGEYQRNYHALYRTFHPFKLRGNWYALYSKDYTATRLMSLPDCKDIGGENREEWGFCPTDYFVPPLSKLDVRHTDPKCPRAIRDGDPKWTIGCKCDLKQYPFEDIWSLPERVHGFIAGCIWGDDSSWKIQYLDLSRADEGVLKREERFGYLEMPSDLDLEKAIEYDGIEYGSVTIAAQKHFNLSSGKDLDDDTNAEPVPETKNIVPDGGREEISKKHKRSFRFWKAS